MTEQELAKLIEIRDGLKSAYWDFDKWRWAAKFDQLIRDTQYAHERNAASYDAMKANAPDGLKEVEDRCGSEQRERVATPHRAPTVRRR